MGKLNLFKELFIIGLSAFAVWTILNPVPGINPELLPDALPYIGNLDEVAAIAILVGAIKRYFGFNPLDTSTELIESA